MTFQRIVRPAAATDVDPHNVSLFPKPPAWAEDSACQRHDPELFFSDSDRLTIREAKAVCKTECPVREKCLSDALDRGEQWGIWGGVNFAAGEQRRLKRGAA